MIHSSESCAGTFREKNPVPVVTYQPITPGTHFAAMKESLPKHEAYIELRNENEHFYVIVYIPGSSGARLNSLFPCYRVLNEVFLTQFQLRPQKPVII